MRRLERRVQRLSGTPYDWLLHQVELQALHEVTRTRPGERIRSFGAAAVSRRPPGDPRGVVEMMVFARVGATLRRPFLNETPAPPSGLDRLAWVPFVMCSEPMADLTRLNWLDLSAVQVRGSRRGYLGDIGPRKADGVTVNPLPGKPRDETTCEHLPADLPTVTISDAAARVWDWQPGRLVPVEYVAVRRETDRDHDSPLAVEILRKRQWA